MFSQPKKLQEDLHSFVESSCTDLNIGEEEGSGDVEFPLSLVVPPQVDHFT